MKETLNKNVVMGDGEVIVTEQVETKYTLLMVQDQLAAIQRQRQRLVSENLYIIDEWEKLNQKEEEFKGYLATLEVGIVELEPIE